MRAEPIILSDPIGPSEGFDLSSVDLGNIEWCQFLDRLACGFHIIFFQLFDQLKKLAELPGAKQQCT